jgi:WD40 repeat protein
LEVSTGPNAPALPLVALTFCPRKNLVAGSDGESCHIWDANTGKLSIRLLSHELLQGIEDLCFDPAGRWLVTGSRTTERFKPAVRLWDAKTGQEMWNSAETLTQSVACVNFSPESGYFLAGSGHKVYVWDTYTHKQSLELTLPAKVTTAALQQDGKRVVIGCNDGHVYLTNLEGRMLGSLNVRPGSKTVRVATFGPDQETLFLSVDSEAVLWSNPLKKMVERGQSLKAWTEFRTATRIGDDQMIRELSASEWRARAEPND